MRLIQTDENDYFLALGTHHITSDRWSFTIFVKELGVIYKSLCLGSDNPLPEPSIQYADWALWQRKELEGDKLDKQLEYWASNLQGELPILHLPGRIKQTGLASFKGAQLPIQFSPELTQALRSLAKAQQVSLFTLCLAAFKALLFRIMRKICSLSL